MPEKMMVIPISIANLQRAKSYKVTLLSIFLCKHSKNLKHSSSQKKQITEKQRITSINVQQQLLKLNATSDKNKKSLNIKLVGRHIGNPICF